MSLFETKMTVSPDTPIIVLSDIHADIDVLIVALRDCARVIRKKTDQTFLNILGKNESPPELNFTPDISETNFRKNENDELLDFLLNLDLLNSDNDKIFDLNTDLGYEWIGNNTHVVIAGDILDGIRYEKNKIITPISDKLNRYIHQYPQIEIKILKFLNKLDILAEQNGGRVIKLIGNHEHGNFTGGLNDEFVKGYAFSNNINAPVPGFSQVSLDLNRLSVENDAYYEKNNKIYQRLNYFNIGNPGFELFRSRGTGIILILNDLIICHGGVPKNMLNDYDKVRNINKLLNKNTVERSDLDHFINSQRGETLYDILWDRTQGDDFKTTFRLKNNDTTHCDSINDFLKKFCDMGLCNKNNAKIIIGHCPQYYATAVPINNSKPFEYGVAKTYKKLTEDGDRNIYDADNINDIYVGEADLSNNIIFGITMECTNASNEVNNRIYKIDVGASRGFDSNIGINGVDGLETKRNMYGRIPQVLEIVDNKVRIIKATPEKMRTSVPRTWLENKFGINAKGQSQPVIQPVIQPVVQPGGYKQKYLKYKQKYLQLKKLL